MDQPLAPYLPIDRRHALATGTPLPGHTQGAALFADISGFTPLTEALTHELGARRGAEELPRQLNLVYDALIQEVERYGGSVIDFAGDAITCWFNEDMGLRATTCALALQQAMHPFANLVLPTGGTVSLAVKVAVASGAVRRFVVGDPHLQLIDTLAGATLSRMAAAEQVAEKGEVVLDEVTACGLGEALELQDWRTDEHGNRFAIVAGLRPSVALAPWPPLSPGSLTTEQLRPWLLPTVYERLQAGQGEFLTELRPVVALFLHFAGIDYDADPEAGAKLDAYICWVQRLLMQYEGTLLSLTMGDKGGYLYLAFGVPVVHEDDARRAALSALALCTPPQALAFVTKTQIGLTSGTMRTGAYGGRTRRTYGALGDAVNLAARLMQAAPPGQIIASRAVQAATGPRFTWQELPPLRVKGKTELVSGFLLLGQSPIGKRPIHLAEPSYILPLVGRITERTRLAQTLALARQGQGQVVGITGEAGMGKSRLVAEAIRLAQEGGFIGYGGECQSYGTTTPYLVWQPIWRAFFGLDGTDTPVQQIAQVARTITALNPSLLPRLPLLAPVLGLPLPDNEFTRSFSPELRKTSCEALLVDVLRARARLLGSQQTAMLLVLEDCHWLDAASHDLLEAVVRAIGNLPVLILLAYRPPDLERRELPRLTPLAHFTCLWLTALGEPEAAHLIASRLAYLNPRDARQPPATLIHHLVTRTEGNPFYLEELLNYLHDQGHDPYDMQALAQVELPTSLHSLILSRIDRLTEAQKSTLKVASIIGRLFRLTWLVGCYPALGESGSVQAHLEALARLDLTPLDSTEPELIYLFKHIVTREVAYESIPYATRAHLHGQLATFLEKQGMAVEGHLDLLAYHYTRSENHAKAREYLHRAGQAAQAVYANDAAQVYYTQLLTLLEDAGEQREIHLRLGTVLELVGAWERAESRYQAALALSPASDPARAQVAYALGKLYRRWVQYEQAQGWLLQALAHWETLGEAQGVSQTLAELGIVAWRQGAFAHARDYLEQSRAICQRRGDAHGLAYALNYLGNISASLQANQAAQRLYEESLALRRTLGDKPGIAGSLNNLALVAFYQGNDEAAQALLEESLSLKYEIGSKMEMAASLNNLGVVAYRRADVAGAERHYRAALMLAHEMGEKKEVIAALLGLAALADSDRLDQLRQGASLLAAAEAQRQALRFTLDPIEQFPYDEALARTRAHLGEPDFAAAWEEGWAMSLDEAIARALTEREPGR